MLDPTSQWGKHIERSLFFLKQASNTELFAPILASCAEILKLSDFRKVSGFYSLVVPMGSPKAAPTAPTHLQTIPDSPHPSPFPPAPGAASHSPPAPPLCPGSSGGVLTPDFPSPVPAPQGVTGRAGAPSASPEGHSSSAAKGTVAALETAGMGQTGPTMAMTQGMKELRTKRTTGLFQWGRSGRKSQAPGGRKTFSAILLKAAARVLSVRQQNRDEGLGEKMKAQFNLSPA